jgi:hypothetical protein
VSRKRTVGPKKMLLLVAGGLKTVGCPVYVSKSLSYEFLSCSLVTTYVV